MVMTFEGSKTPLTLKHVLTSWSYHMKMTMNATHTVPYAQVVRIFHLDVFYFGVKNSAASAPLCMHVLFARWFGRDITFNAGWSRKRLHWLGYFKGDVPHVSGSLTQIESFAVFTFVCREEGDDDWQFLYEYVCIISLLPVTSTHNSNR
jgi:hypothetical protein